MNQTRLKLNLWVLIADRLSADLHAGIDVKFSYTYFPEAARVAASCAGRVDQQLAEYLDEEHTL